MNLGIIISSTDPETVFNALRLANFSLSKNDSVLIFLIGKGVELGQIQDERFNVREQADKFLVSGGKIMACGTCLKLRNSEGSDKCPLSTMGDLYEMISRSDRIVSF